MFCTNFLPLLCVFLVQNAASFHSDYVSALDEITNAQFRGVRYGFMSRERYHDVVKSLKKEMSLMVGGASLENEEIHQGEKISKEIERILEEVRKEQAEIYGRMAVSSDKNIEKVRNMIFEQVFKFTRQARMGFNASLKYEPFTRDECLNSARPDAVAKILLKILKKCGKPKLDVTLLETIDENLKSQHYDEQLINGYTEKLKAIVYMHYESNPDGVNLYRKDAANFAKLKGHSFTRADDFLYQFIMFWKTDSQNECLFKTNYINSKYQRDNVLDLLRTIEQDLMQLTFSAVFCSQISYRDDPRGAETYLNSFLEVAEPIRDWLDTWVDQFLRNSWPGIHKIAARKFIVQYPMKTMENGTADELANELKKSISKVGHASHTFEIIVTELEDVIQRSGKFFLESRPQNHWILLQNKVCNVLIVKTNVSDTERHKNLQKAVAGLNEPFKNLMKTKYYNKAAIADVVYGLKSDLVDFTDFKHHNVLIGLHATKRWGKCPVKVGFSEVTEKQEIQHMSFYLPSGYLYSCQHFLFILI